MPSFSKRLAVVVASAGLLVSQTAAAHVAFLNEGGAVLTPGEVVTLEWTDVIPHITVAYHLEFLMERTAEPVPIVSDLAPDVHSYDWVVPDVQCSECLVRVVQDNDGADYDGFWSISIGTDAPGAGGEMGGPATSSTTGGTTTSSMAAGGATSTSAASTSAASTSAGPTTSSTTGATASTSVGGSMGTGGLGGSEPATSSTRSSGGCSLASAPSTSPAPFFALLALGMAALRRRRPR